MKRVTGSIIIVAIIVWQVGTFVLSGLTMAVVDGDRDAGAEFSVGIQIKRLNGLGEVLLATVFLTLFWLVYSTRRKRRIRESINKQTHPSSSFTD
jgi:hypothetical protein